MLRVTPVAQSAVMDDRYRHIAALAATQHSVISAAQFVDLGVTSSHRSKWERGGLISRLGAHSFVMAGSVPTFERSLAGGLADLDGHGAVAGRALGRLQGLDGFSEASAEFVVPRANRMASTDGLVCSTSRPLTNGDKVTVKGFQCLTTERMILESPLFGFTKAETENAIDSAIRLLAEAIDESGTIGVRLDHRPADDARCLD